MAVEPLEADEMKGGKVQVAQAADSYPSHIYTGAFLIWKDYDWVAYLTLSLCEND